MAIKTVAVVGASGSIGAHIVAALLAADFTVTAITRPTSTSTFPPEVQVRRPDPSSYDELKAALAGQDAVVSATGAPVTIGAGEDPLIDAAAAAGVRRFIPSEYGHATHRFAEDEPLKGIIGRKIRTLEYIKEKAKKNEGFSWTVVETSMWFDWGLDTLGLGVNIPERTTHIIDSGDEVWSTTSLPFVARAVVAIFQREEETKNKTIEVVEFQTTQNELLKALEAETGSKFAVTHESSEHLKKAAFETQAKGDQWGAFVKFLHLWAFKDGMNHAVPDEETANKLLGLPAPSRDVRAGVQEYLKNKKV